MQPDSNQPPTPPTDPVSPTPPTDPVSGSTPGPIEPPTAPSPFGPPTSPLNSMPSSPSTAPVSSGPAPSSPSPKSKKPLLIVLIIALLLLIAGAAAAYFFLMPQGSNNTVDNNAAQDAGSTPAGEKQAITATKGSDLKELCNNKKVTNALAANKPYVIAPYISNGDIWAIFPITGNDENYSLNLAEANVVACMLPDTSTATAARACEATNFETKAKHTVQYAGVSYTVSFYAAQTGEKLSEGVVVASGDMCPVYAKEQDEVLYALPTNSEATPVFESFITENA